MKADTRVICPNCNRSIPHLNSYHYCKESSIDELFISKPDHVVLAFDRLLSLVSEFENIEISATKRCVVFVRNKTFLVAKPMSKCLEIKFYSKEPIEDDQLHKCQLWGGKYESILRINQEGQLGLKAANYFKESYLIS